MNWHRIFLTWHRKIGISIAIVVIFLSLTGLLLNHTETLNLAQININQSLILKRYHIQTDRDIQYFSEQDFKVALVDQDLYINQLSMDIEGKKLRGIGHYNQDFLVLIDDQLLIFNQALELLESVSVDDGLPNNIVKMAVQDQQLYLANHQNVYQFYMDSLEVERIQSKKRIHWSKPTPIPEKLINDFSNQTDAKGLPLERIILDLHSGRFFGQIGVYIVDFIALLMIFLSISGVYMWSQRLKKRR